MITLRPDRRVGVALAMAAVLPLAGCSPTSSSPGSRVSPQAPGGIARLAPVPQGTINVSRDSGTHAVVAVVDIFGLSLRSKHAVVLRAGSCKDPGAVATTFPDLTADAFGTSKQSLTSPAGAGPIPTPASVAIMLKPAAEQAGSPDGRTGRIACADVSPSGGQATMKGFTDLSPSGTVTLAYASSGTVVVHVAAHGLPASSSHAVHIHFGSCRQQSGVLYAVGDAKADASGTVDATFDVKGLSTPPPAQGWYADIHIGSGTQIVSNGQPTPFFQAILCGDGTYHVTQ